MIKVFLAQFEDPEDSSLHLIAFPWEVDSKPITKEDIEHKIHDLIHMHKEPNVLWWESGLECATIWVDAM